MKHRDFKDRLYAELARIAKALDSPRRLEMIDLLAQGERSVEDLAAEASLSLANTSRHLQVLRAARVVERRKDGFARSIGLRSRRCTKPSAPCGDWRKRAWPRWSAWSGRI